MAYWIVCHRQWLWSTNLHSLPLKLQNSMEWLLVVVVMGKTRTTEYCWSVEWRQKCVEKGRQILCLLLRQMKCMMHRPRVLMKSTAELFRAPRFSTEFGWKQLLLLTQKYYYYRRYCKQFHFLYLEDMVYVMYEVNYYWLRHMWAIISMSYSIKMAVIWCWVLAVSDRYISCMEVCIADSSPTRPPTEVFWFQIMVSDKKIC